MTIAKAKTIVTGDAVFDDPEFVLRAAESAFKKAAKAAVAENDRLGITTHGAVDGKLTERRPALVPQKP
jgi:hypothetical protein